MGIEILDPEVVGKIAAGEVVERPASVVKELVENALDAGARSVQVETVAGGCDLIRVADDGRGIPREELRLAVERHATSKIRRAEDLSRVSTLGFRGEALASIAAVSRMTVASRTADSASAYQLTMEGASEGEVVAVARAAGTTVAVETLFFNVPARRKFLRSASAEAAQIAHLLGQLALAYPEVAFTLLSDGRKSLATPGSGVLLDCALAVLGREVAGALLPLEALVETDRPVRGLGARITGLVADPTMSRATRSAIWLFVNRRPVRSRSLSYAVEEGFETLLQVGRYPIAIVNLQVPLDDVDVNVHPSKSEVRLLRERLIYAGIRDAVREAVAENSAWGKNLSGLTPATQQGPEVTAAPRLLDAPISAPPGSNEMVAGGRKLPILRVIGQVAQTYIVAEAEHGLYLIDQHAAHERVLLERLMKSVGADGNTQLLLEPFSLDVGAPEWEVIEASLPVLESMGYRLEPFGERSLLVRGVPMELPGGRAIDALKDALADLSGEGVGTGTDWRERVAVALSCRGAVKAGQVLAPEEMRSLVLALEEMDITQHCSHGRPTAVLLSRSQLEREFGRR